MTGPAIAITGANGFLGRHCVREALQMGFNVKGVVRRRIAADLVESLGAESVLVKNFNSNDFIRAFQGCDSVLHFIGIVNERYNTFLEVNVRGTRLVLECAYESNVARFVTPSGLGVDQYGKRSWATNGYFWSKRKIEDICLSNTGFCVVFRPSYILGPGDELIPGLVNSILNKRAYIVEGGEAPMQPIFVEDAATAFMRAASGWGEGGSIYDLVGPEVITFSAFITRVARIMEEEGFTVPDYEIYDLSKEEANETLDISREEIDVMLCDIVGDPGSFTRDFQVDLTPLDEAIREAVLAVKEGEE